MRNSATHDIDTSIIFVSFVSYSVVVGVIKRAEPKKRIVFFVFTQPHHPHNVSLRIKRQGAFHTIR